MFRCDMCFEQQPTYSKPNLIITETRLKSYPARYKEGICVDSGGRGWEIVKEIKVCDKCKRGEFQNGTT